MRFFKIFLIALTTIFIIIPQGYGYVGYEKHPMEGNSIFPLTDVNIKLSEIKVLMESEEKGVAIKVKSEYFLENLSDEEVNFKVAFPVESNCIGCTKMPDDFSVLVNGTPVQTSMGKIIKKDLLLKISKGISLKDVGREAYMEEIPLVIWGISFKPKEKKIITNTYTLEWYIDAGAVSLMYDLSTLSLWKGKIEKAYFKLVIPQDLMDDIKSYLKDPSLWPQIDIRPLNYKIKNDVIEWFFKNLQQEKIGYIHVGIDYRKPGVVGD
jgi:hypothetical protein